MPRLVHRPFPSGFARILALIAATLVAGCQLAPPGSGGPADADVTPNAVTGEAIEVTALDAPPLADAPVPEAAATTDPAGETAEAGPVPPQPSEPAAETVAEPVAEPAPEPAPDPAPELQADPAPVPEGPAEEKSQAQLDCEKRDGRWSAVGSGVLRACVFETRDSGKRCERESQCEGVCLARSGTCSPVKPLFGCHEILQDNGARVTLCIK